MSILKSALVACVMTTSALVVGYLLPVVINPASAQAFPPCRNDFRAEIAAGQRSPHYPRCLDAHSPRGPSLQGEPQIENQAFNCPSGQVFSGGSCITIQNQAPYGRAWTSYFVGQRKCVPVQTWIGGTACAEIANDGRVLWYRGGAYLGFSQTPIELNPASFGQQYYIDGLYDQGSAWPTGHNPMTGSAPTSWSLSFSQTCPACN